MKFSENWLREFVDPDVSSEDLVEQLTMAGLEIETVESCHPGFTGVVVARVNQVEPHPEADKLRICRVDDGSGSELQVVCGAPRVAAGECYALAGVGAVLPGGRTVEAARIRGQESRGMLCSGLELGLSDDGEALLSLGANAPLGDSLADFLDLDDAIIEVSLTPNRGDCLSLVGIAREVAVLNNLPFDLKSVNPIPYVTNESRDIKLQEPAACPRYCGRVISEVDCSRSTPVWIAERLRRSDIRRVNVVVDIVNLVMLELGQPMHAFDNAALKGAIGIRYARKAETLLTLDGQERPLTPDTLVITDGSGPVAMAGIMGGEPTAVNGDTRQVFLESAWFAPEAIMGRARRYGLHTDASHRFERGVSASLQARAVERATALIMATCGGKPGPASDVYDEDRLPAKQLVRFRVAEVERRLGFAVSPTRCQEILDWLGFDIDRQGTAVWQVRVPAHRFDISLEADLIEEIARVYGYNAIPSTPPRAGLRMQEGGNGALPETATLLVGRGYHEVITYSFVEPGWQAQLLGQEQAVPLLNPISTEMSVMRRSLLPGLLQAVQYNVKRQQQRIRLFELGKVYRPGTPVHESLMLGGAIYGIIYPEQWDIKDSYSDLFDMKGDVEAILQSLAGAQAEIRFAVADSLVLQEGQAAEVRVAGQAVGIVGALAPGHRRRLDLPQNVFVFELELPLIPTKEPPKYTKLSKYPSIRRDLAILVDEAVPVASLMQTIRERGGEHLYNLQLFDLYRGEGIDLGKKSLALGLTFQGSSSTLTDAEVEKCVTGIVKSLQQRFGAALRE